MANSSKREPLNVNITPARAEWFRGFRHRFETVEELNKFVEWLAEEGLIYMSTHYTADELEKQFWVVTNPAKPARK